MDECLKGTWNFTEEDKELQKCFWALFASENQCPGIKIGTKFCRKIEIFWIFKSHFVGVFYAFPVFSTHFV